MTSKKSFRHLKLMLSVFLVTLFLLSVLSHVMGEEDSVDEAKTVEVLSSEISDPVIKEIIVPFSLTWSAHTYGDREFANSVKQTLRVEFDEFHEDYLK